MKEASAEYRIARQVNDCPVGYKRTEVGVIPEDWKLSVLEGICGVIDGDRGSNYPSGKDFSDQGYCVFLSAANVTKDGFKFDELNFISKEKDEALRNGKLVTGDVVLTTRGSVGHLSFYDESIPYENMRINSGMVLIRKESNEIEAGYLYLLLSSFVVGQQISKMTFGSAQPQLTVKGINNFVITFPSNKKEQTAIANAIFDVDALITSLETLITKKRAIKTAAMQQLLTGKKRLPPYDKTHTGYKQTELGEIPEDWEVVSYGQAFQFLLTATNSRSDLGEDGDTLYVHYGDVHMRWDSVVDFSKDYVPTIARHKVGKSSLLKDGDLVMADASEDYEGIGKSVEVFGLNGLCAVAGLHTFLLRDTGMFVDGYRGYLHLIESTKKQFDRLATGLKVYGLSKGNLKDVLLPVPPKEE
ncbi:MAG: restriction endonuclease subunit S, partial [Actinobacteria bacterium]|nr:restriction endonuclease subunit S [Actinomycetota bacterium]